MSAVKILRTETRDMNGYAIIGKYDVWLTFCARWWNVRAWVWWLTCPYWKEWILVDSKAHGQELRVRAIQIGKLNCQAGEVLP
jgi:hypothetical protein